MKNQQFEKKLVSVIIPVYNRKNTIERSVSSVLAQTYENIEIILVDDGSTDGTLDILEKLKEEKIQVYKQNHRGANAARNFGIKKAKGEFIAFQDSDDEWMPDKLECQITYMLEHHYEVCYCPFFLYQEGFREIIPKGYEDKEKYEKNLINVLKVHNVVSTQTLVIHRNVIIDVGLFDEEMPRYQDYEYAIRIIQKKKIGYVSKLLVNVYQSENSISNDEEKSRTAKRKLAVKHGNFFSLEEALRNEIRRAMNLFEGIDLLTKIEKINSCLNTYWKEKKLDIYKIATEILWHEYKAQRKEYEMRVSHLHSYEFAIYGAGAIGRRIYRELLEKKLKPQCFLVTDKKDTGVFDGVPIIVLEEWNEKNKEIIIGVSCELQMELIKNLINKGYTNYFRYLF